jgi:hypothetical protein
MANTATAKQIAYALVLLSKAGYSTKFMDASFKNLGASMRECGGTVQDWLAGMDGGKVSKLITELRD